MIHAGIRLRRNLVRNAKRADRERATRVDAVTTGSLFRRLSRARGASLIGACVLIAAIFGANELFLRKLRDDTLETTAVNLKSQVTVLASEVDRSLKRLDLTLSSLSNHIAGLGVNDGGSLREKMSSKEFHQFLKDQWAGLTRVESIVLASDQGKVVNFSRSWPVPDIDVSNRDDFQALKSDPSLETFVSEPAPNKATGTWTAHLARRLNSPDGDFIGMIFGSIALESYASYFKTVALQEGSSIVLLRSDGMLLARYPWSGLVGQKMPLHNILQSTTPSAIQANSPIDDQQRIVASIKLANFPISILASQTEAAALRNWRSFAVLSYSLAAGSSLLLILVLVLLTQRWRKQELLSEKLSVQNLRFDAALRHMSQGLCLFDADRKVVVSNLRYAQLYHLSEQQVKPGTTLAQILEARREKGTGFAVDPDEYANVNIKRAHEILRLADGRIVSIRRHAMPDGGWLTTHEDVTAEQAAEKLAAEKTAALERTNLHLDAALGNMSQGLCMFDSEKRLVVCNDRYAEIYQLPPELVKVGTPYSAIVADRAARGLLKGVVDAPAAKAKVAELTGLAKDAVRVDEFADGRVMLIARRPTKDGGWISTHEDITERRRAEAEIVYLARHDALTGLANRAQFGERLEEASKRARRNGTPFTLMMLDLDKFKAVNDTLGHPAGDKLLVEVALRLKASIRDTDVLARLGGDEFAIIQDDGASQHEGAIALALRIIDAITRPFDLDGNVARVGTSIGIALAPEHGTDPEDVLKKADLALYAAKAGGRNDYRLFSSEMSESAETQRNVEGELQDAIARGEFELRYQPFVDAGTGRLQGVEALVRWRHPTRGLIAPDQFIPLAESTGLIVPLGAWILQQACADAAAWPAHVKVAINISAVQFSKGNLFDLVLCALVETGLAPDRLELEITESSLLENQAAHLSTIRQLKNLGISLALDDFGTGYSSANYLTNFPFDKIKIDKSFTQGCLARRDCRAVVSSVIALAQGLGIITTAEGVETSEQLDYLRSAGVDLMQGYLFGRPVPLAELDLEATPRPATMVA